MKKIIFLLLTSLAFINITNGQKVGIGTAAPDNSALLDLTSINRGVLVPRMNLVQRGNIGSPATGLLIYQIDNNPGFYFYNGSTWTSLGADNLGNHNATQNIHLNGFKINNTETIAGTGISMDNNGTVLIKAKDPSNVNAVLDTTLFISPVGAIYAKATLGTGTIPRQGKGLRFMWYPFKGGMRAGNVDGSQWDDANFGFYSNAFGNNTTASAFGSFVTGDGSTASGTDGIAMGSQCKAIGTASVCLGASAESYGFCGVALGFNNHINGQGAVAIGYRCNALGDYSVALGHRATSLSFSGCMVMGDESTIDSVRASVNNQFTTRYAGGYRLYTNATRTTGVLMAAGGSSWASVSDSTKKENFEPASREDFLQKLATLKLGSWNYKGQEAATFRHYGPMAQEIFAAYGKDQLGVIGCDTLLASADMDGIMMILLQGLEKRSTIQKEENALLKTQLTGLVAEVKSVKNENALLKAQLAKVNSLQEQLMAMQRQLSEAGTATISGQLLARNKHSRKP